MGVIHLFRNYLITILIGCSPCVSLKLDVFNTRTIYRWPYEAIVNTPVVDNSGSSFTMGHEDCEAMQVYAVVRHGARYPTGSAVNNIAGLMEKILKHKDPDAFLWLDTWKNRYPNGNEGFLCQEGIDEQVNLGKRLGRMYKRLFHARGNRVKFVSSFQPRASNSSKYFHLGISDEVGSFEPYVNEINNTLTRFYDKCHNYVTQVEDNASHMMEFEKYSKTFEFQNVATSIKERLGMDVNLSASDVYQINVLCSYELTLFGEDKWCGLLNVHEREVLEYGKDIEKYYLKGYSHPIIPKMACPLFDDILATMRRSKDDMWDYWSKQTDFTNTGYLSGKFVFGHETTTLPLMTLLGLYKDKDKLLASNRAAMKNRQFRTSHIAPYTANVATVMYACSGREEEYRRRFVVKLFVNEREVTIPACNKVVCTYEEFITYYSPMVEHCDLGKICGGDEDIGDLNGATTFLSGRQLSIVFPLMFFVANGFDCLR